MQLSTNVGGALLCHQRVDSGVLQAGSAVALHGLNNLVWLIDGLRIEHRYFLAIPLQQDLVALLDAGVVNVKSHWQAENLLLWEAHALHNSVILGLGHEARQWAEGTAGQAEDIASLALVQVNGVLCLSLELGLGGLILDEAIYKGAAMRSALGGGACVDTALRLGLADETASSLGLMGKDWDSGVDISEGLEHVCDGCVALDLCLSALPERLF
mmetsp:Transcript_61807/g.147473  ORF Transcript_61807/g.147473 Transcript_61807/m.147473 type:complete len:214 (-) Transcript_61807:23-664(-)